MSGAKQRAVSLLRRLGLLEAADALGMTWESARRLVRRDPLAESLGAPLPPNRVAYDAYGAFPQSAYWASGLEAAGHLAQHTRRLAAQPAVLEWGCGPARLIRHLPGLLPGAALHGCDYNEETIRWCQENIPGVSFAVNGLNPPLSYADASFDCVYAISVFTHLSPAVQIAWATELERVLKPGGTLMCTLHGDAARERLLPDERADYDAGKPVVRGNVTEGRRTFLAYHPARFVREELLAGLEVVAHEPAPHRQFWLQDFWVARKPA